jgi:hypothetical protein
MTTITPRQQSFVRNLLEERATVLGITDVDAYIAEQSVNTLTAKGASALIERLKTIPVGRKPEWSHLPDGRVIVNRFAKDCAQCNGEVEAGKGFAVQVGSSWLTYHKQGECHAPGETLASVPTGYYALPSATGNNDLDFFVVHESRGVKVVSRVIGGKADKRLGGTQARDVTARLNALTDAEKREAMALFGREIGQCGMCGRHLTDETSRAHGLGSECRRK